MLAEKQFLPESHVQRCTESLRDILSTSSIHASDLDAPILNSEIKTIERDLSIVQSLVIHRTPASVILEKTNLTDKAVSLDEVLNSPTPFYNEPSRSEASNSMLQEMFDSRIQSTEEVTKNNQEILDQNSRFTVSHVTQSLSKNPDK